MTGAPAWTIGEPRLLLGLDQMARLDWTQHRRLHGDRRRLDRAGWTDLASAVGLLGRGGAGFPVARKLAAIPPSGAYAVMVNGSESEPLSGKDRTLLQRTPHLVLDGALGVAEALRCRRIIVSVHDDAAAASIRAAVQERQDAPRVTVVTHPGGFVAGEARAVVRAASGGPALPHGRRTLPSDDGLHGRPTFLSNAETFAQLAILAEMGPTTYTERGISEEPGTSLLSISGSVRRPGVVEISNGVPLAVVLEAAGADLDGAVLVGGYHGSWVEPPHAPLALSRPALRQAGLSFGAGVVAVLTSESCPLGEVQQVADWLAAQSAGQCGPCVFGLPALVDDLRLARAGDPRARHQLERHAGMVTGRGACAHPDGVARFVASSVHRFRDDLAAHARHGSCGRPVIGCLGLGSPADRDLVSLRPTAQLEGWMS